MASSSLLIGITSAIVGYIFGKQYGKQEETLNGQNSDNSLSNLDCDRALENCNFICEKSMYYQKYYPDKPNECLKSCMKQNAYCFNPFLVK